MILLTRRLLPATQAAACSLPRRLLPATPALVCATRRSACTAAQPRTSFIGRAKEANSAAVLIGPFQSAGFYDACLEDAGMEVTQIDRDGATCELTVTPSLANNYHTLHGGAIATIVDVVGTLALLGRDPLRPGVSVEMNQSFCAAAKVGERVAITGSVLRYGKTLGFTEVTITAQESKRVVAVGRHTKFFAPPPPPTPK